MTFYSRSGIKSRKRRLGGTIAVFLAYLGIMAALSQIKFSPENNKTHQDGGGGMTQLKLRYQPSFFIRSLLQTEKSNSKAAPNAATSDRTSTENEKTSNNASVVKTTNGIALNDASAAETSAETNTKIATETTLNITLTDKTTTPPPKIKCVNAAIEQFPKPLMSIETRQGGGLIVHILVTLYLFIAIAIVCDEFFVPSLEMMCDRMEMTADVAGATFMAAGSSAPELATSIIAVFVAKDDIGISGVIGSAVFNILFVIAICAIFAGHVVPINWWPLMRDTTCYCISIFALLITIANEVISWYEGLFLLILYGFYILLMVYNKEAEAWANTLNIPFKSATRDEKSSLFDGRIPVQPGQQDSQKQGETEQNGSPVSAPVANMQMEIEASQPKSMAPEKREEDLNLWEVPVGLWERIKWSTTLPLVAAHYISIPDCRVVRWRRWYMGTFFMSMVWISIYSYVMVWMITIIGFTLGIPDTVMGLTFIAIGVSVSDVISSLCVAKQGFGDMAVTNAIGSNVFDILICLGLPWFIKTSIIDPGSTVPVESRGLTYSTISLFSTVIFLIAATHYNGWKLDVKYGIALLVWYLIFMIVASLYELNVFGDFNPPACPSLY